MKMTRMTTRTRRTGFPWKPEVGNEFRVISGLHWGYIGDYIGILENKMDITI